MSVELEEGVLEVVLEGVREGVLEGAGMITENRNDNSLPGPGYIYTYLSRTKAPT